LAIGPEQSKPLDLPMSYARQRLQRRPVIAAPLRKQVVELLRGAIIAYEYAPGQRLVERDLCERFDVSRTVIREVLRHLEAEGLVELVPNRGPIVSSTSLNDARSLYEVRESLEALAARRCAERATPTQKRRLRRALDQVEAAYQKRKVVDELAAMDFYRIMCEGANNAVIASMLRTIQARVQMLRHLALESPGRPEESLDELRGVVDAIERGDAEAAAQLASAHVRNAGRAGLQRLSEIEAEKRPAAAV
jgi:DNA-binding GntR family transcriptional regulator